MDNWIETLDHQEYVEVARTEAGLFAFITAKGKLALDPVDPLDKRAPEMKGRTEAEGSEDFCDPKHEFFLKKYGTWVFDTSIRCWTGEGEGSYLLSSNYYGERPFWIQTSVRFGNYKKFQNRGIDTANAGIVIGWNESYQYYGHILLNGRNVSYELVSRDDPYMDFVPNIGKGEEFNVEENRQYRLVIKISGSQLWVSIDGITVLLYPECSLQPGRVSSPLEV